MRLWQPFIFCLALSIIDEGLAQTDAGHRSNRQMAVTVCNDYRETNRLPCFVSRKACPSGFEAIEHFSNNRDPSFSACRDKRHEQPAMLNRSSQLFTPRNQQLLDQFNQLISKIEKQQTGSPVPLPRSSKERLSLFFSAVDLGSIRLIHSKTLRNGCFTDCRQIFCASKNRIESWTNPQSPTLTFKLLHQLAHAEQCEIQGGRDRFIQLWLHHLPEDVFDTLENGEPLDAEKIHYATYMESHANNRAESICRRVGCMDD